LGLIEKTKSKNQNSSSLQSLIDNFPQIKKLQEKLTHRGKMFSSSVYAGK